MEQYANAPQNHSGYHKSHQNLRPLSSKEKTEISDAYLMQKEQQLRYHKAVQQQRASENEVKDKKSKHAEKSRKDSWDSEEEDDENKANGIGKLKISREMRQKLEALTTSHPSR